MSTKEFLAIAAGAIAIGVSMILIPKYLGWRRRRWQEKNRVRFGINR